MRHEFDLPCPLCQGTIHALASDDGIVLSELPVPHVEVGDWIKAAYWDRPHKVIMLSSADPVQPKPRQVHCEGFAPFPEWRLHPSWIIRRSGAPLQVGDGGILRGGTQVWIRSLQGGGGTMCFVFDPIYVAGTAHPLESVHAYPSMFELTDPVYRGYCGGATYSEKGTP